MSRKRKEPDSTFERGVPSYSNEKGESVSIGNVYIGDNCWETVFRYLDQVKDRSSVLLTCKRWNERGTRLLDPSANDNYAIKRSSKRGYEEAVKSLLGDERVDPTVDEDYPITRAVKYDRTKIVSLLLKDGRADPTAHENYPITFASKHGREEVVILLLKDKRADPAAPASSWDNDKALWMAQDGKRDPTLQDNYPITRASAYGHDGIVKLLLDDERVDPTADDNYAIKITCEGGRAKVVKLLLEDGRADPTALFNYPIKQASLCGHKKVAKLLLKDGRADPTAHMDDADIIQRGDVSEDLLFDPCYEYDSAIDMASGKGHADVVELLLRDHRVDPTADRKASPVYKAAAAGNWYMVRLLLEHNVKWFHRTHRGHDRDYLINLARWECPDVAELLDDAKRIMRAEESEPKK